MFDHSDKPRVFGLPPGADFPTELASGIRERTDGGPPEDLARLRLYVNTRRMQRRVRDIFTAGPPSLLPRILTVADVGPGLPTDMPNVALSALSRQLELTQLVSALLDAEPGLAPRSAAFELAGSLAALLDEMAGEGVPLSALRKLDVGEHSAHWARSLRFLGIVETYVEALGSHVSSAEARQRAVIERLIEGWVDAPPDTPVLVAGTTGSRGTTALLLQAVAQLPRGAVVLPGFDFHLPDRIWGFLQDKGDEDHPQYRYAAYLGELGIAPGDVRPWRPEAAPAPARNRLVSLALRPAPVTNQWLSDGKALGDLRDGTMNLSLIEAPSERHEAVAIALALREALEQGRTAALVTPDRMLTRRVTALLDRWGIEPDDSAGRPLSQSAPGRLLLHIANGAGRRLTAEQLLVLLKHPLAARGGDRGPHLLCTRELELWLRRNGIAFPTADGLENWAKSVELPVASTWSTWVTETLLTDAATGRASVQTHISRCVATAERLVSGGTDGSAAPLWAEVAGEMARNVVDELSHAGTAGGTIAPPEFASILRTVLGRADLRDPVRPHPDVMIWGTLEARVQGARRVILGGLNEDTWPTQSRPDPWLNRALRKSAGLLLPERQIGLAAHDFQQAIAAEEAILSRPCRTASVEPVPSRWLNRLANLLEGLPEQHGPDALKAMKARGSAWLEQVAALETIAEPVPPAPRPSPCPPAAARPKKLSVTEIQTLIRDPYAIYAKHVLRLPRLNAFKQDADAPLRGTILHEIFAAYADGETAGSEAADQERLLDLARNILSRRAPFPVARHLWFSRIERIAGDFVRLDRALGDTQTLLGTELSGALRFEDLGFTLTARADRIDQAPNGLVILDYKSGDPPTRKEMQAFDKQILLEAVIAENGGFDPVLAETVDHVAYIGLKAPLPHRPIALVDDGEHDFSVATVRAGFVRLISGFQSPSRGFTSRRAVKRRGFEGDYDHLARFGEWDESAAATPEPLA